MGEEFKMSCHLTSRAPDPLSHRLNLAQVGGIEGKDSIRLPKLGLLDYYGFRLVISRLGHLSYLLLIEIYFVWFSITSF